MFHNRVTLNDSTAARRQPAVPAAGQRQQRHRRQPRRRRRRGRPAVRHDRRSTRCSSTRPRTRTRPACSARLPLELHRRCDLRRPPRPLPAARAQHQPAAARHDPGEPGRQHRRAAPLQGLRRHPPVGERRPLEVQQPAAQRRPPLHATASSSGWPTRSASRRTTRATSATSCSTRYDDTGYWGPSNFDRRHVLNFYYIYDLPFLQGAELAGVPHPRRMADFGRDVHAHGHAVVGDAATTTSPVSAMPSRKPYNQVGDPNDERQSARSRRALRAARH